MFALNFIQVFKDYCPGEPLALIGNQATGMYSGATDYDSILMPQAAYELLKENLNDITKVTVSFGNLDGKHSEVEGEFFAIENITFNELPFNKVNDEGFLDVLMDSIDEKLIFDMDYDKMCELSSYIYKLVSDFHSTFEHNIREKMRTYKHYNVYVPADQEEAFKHYCKEYGINLS